MPDQDPDTIAKLFEDHIRTITPKTVEVTVTRMHGGKPWMTEFDNPYVKAAGRAILMIDAFQTGSVVAPRDRSHRHFLTFNRSDDAARVVA